MKKKLLIIIIIFVLILMNYANISFGFIKKDYNSNIMVVGWNGKTTKEILSDLNNKLGYGGSSLKEEIKLKTSLKITAVKDTFLKKQKKYQIKFRR